MAAQDYRWVGAAAVAVLLAVVIVVAEPCSLMAAPLQRPAGDGRGSRQCSPYPTCYSSLSGMDGTLSLLHPRAVQVAPTCPFLVSHRR